MNNTRTKAAPTQVGKGNEGTSPARYAAAVAAETIAVEAKSRRRSAAPTSANFFVEMFRLDAKIKGGGHMFAFGDSHVSIWRTTYR